MATKKQNSAIAHDRSCATPETLALYEKLVATLRVVERRGDTVPYTSRNGHRFSYIGEDGLLALRLPKDLLEIFLNKYNSKNAMSYGDAQREYAVVPPALLKKTSELQPYFLASYRYIGSLKPKPVARKLKGSNRK